MSKDNTCICGHAKAEHGERLARQGKVRTLSDGCFKCSCENYEALAGKSDTMTPEQRRRKLESIERQLSYLIGQVRELK